MRTEKSVIRRAGVLLLALAVVIGTLPIMGCNAATSANVAQDVVNWTPALVTAVAVIDATASVLDPASARIFAAATTGIDAASSALVVQAKAYLAKPNASTLAQLQAQIVTLQQQVNTSLLESARIVNPVSQQKALTDLNAVATVVNAILSLVQSVSSPTSVAQMSAASTIKLATVRPLLRHSQIVGMVAQHYNEPVLMADVQVGMAERRLAALGF